VSTLTHDEIRAAVATYAPDRLPCFDDMTSKPLSTPGQAPIDWNPEMRVSLFLYLWTDYNPQRPN
jgi:hypothetical protein